MHDDCRLFLSSDALIVAGSGLAVSIGETRPAVRNDKGQAIKLPNVCSTVLDSGKMHAVGLLGCGDRSIREI